jgi:hypothetical protein
MTELSSDNTIFMLRPTLGLCDVNLSVGTKSLEFWMELYSTYVSHTDYEREGNKKWVLDASFVNKKWVKMSFKKSWTSSRYIRFLSNFRLDSKDFSPSPNRMELEWIYSESISIVRYGSKSCDPEYRYKHTYLCIFFYGDQWYCYPYRQVAVLLWLLGITIIIYQAYLLNCRPSSTLLTYLNPYPNEQGLQLKGNG